MPAKSHAGPPAVPGQAGPSARQQLRRIAEEQAALRRIAEQVARTVQPEQVFAAVTEEVHRLIQSDFTTLSRFNLDKTLTIVGSQLSAGNVHAPVGHRGALGGRNTTTMVFLTGRPARLDDMDDDAAGPPLSPGMPAEARATERAVAIVRSLDVRSAVSVPISVGGRLWGALSVGAGNGRRLPSDTEERLANFSELVAIAIANAEARTELSRVADEQAALRRVATLVARGQPPAAIFAAVAKEVSMLYGADNALIIRFEPDGQATSMGAYGVSPDLVAGARGPVLPGSLAARVRETHRAARFDADDTAQSGITETITRQFCSAVDAPIVVDDRLWGMIGLGSRTGPLHSDTERRLADFVELVATAISNAEAQAELRASRARIVATADQTRRRIERDLHDGAQQRLVALALQMRAAQACPPQDGALDRMLSQMATETAEVLDELREIAHGLHPAVLAVGGLSPALSALARRSSVPVRLHTELGGRLPEPVEIAAYYVVCEALTNAAKHARASVADVQVTEADGVLRVRVGDDGRGGADFTGSSGLIGLKDRVEALGGRISLDSPPGGGTTVEITLPLRDTSDHSARTRP